MVLLESKEALIEAINADIVNNGKKGITGDTLNLILNSIVGLMGTGSGGGGNVYRLPIELLSATADAPYDFGDASAAFLEALSNPETIFLASGAESGMYMSMLFSVVMLTDQDDGSTLASMVGTMPSVSGSSVCMIFQNVTLTIVGSSVTGYAEVAYKPLQ